MDNKDDQRIGEELVALLQLKPLRRPGTRKLFNPPRYATSWGGKTASGLACTVRFFMRSADRGRDDDGELPPNALAWQGRFALLAADVVTPKDWRKLKNDVHTLMRGDAELFMHTACETAADVDDEFPPGEFSASFRAAVTEAVLRGIEYLRIREPDGEHQEGNERA